MSESKVREAMIAAHDALDGGVYLVMALEGGVPFLYGIFSTVEKAKVWMDTLDDKYSCICAPFVVDSPDYGNVPRSEMQ